MSVRWEVRWHPLREEWVVVAAHRQDRPWTGAVLEEPKKRMPPYDPDCYLCPGNLRASGERNPAFKQTFVFNNDFPCVGEDVPRDIPSPRPPYQRQPPIGIARVVCFHARHDLTLAEMTVDEVDAVLRVWHEQFRELSQHPDVNSVLMFENKGEVVGVSNPHPHGQIYATHYVSQFVAIGDRASERYLRETGRLLFGDILRNEREDESRIVVENDNAVAFVPYFARYAYETYVAPKNHRRDVSELSPEERKDFASVLLSLLVRYDNLWKMSFPYVMALHNRPTDGNLHDGFWFHIEIHPPLRKPNLLKYHGGAEIGGGNFLSDTWPDDKADELRRLPDTHYKRHQAPEPRV